ncbi:4-alpha-glucanotransferase [Endozoicomonas acroporae]|uniref:4-alpha-glucanotransferase n=1 Tax=Endozoicomonas acroporae TaxID=1701104 RepID=UPI000C78782B|nr:4-alpha-glucanotransferase [Endozoicomonas acroporae]
MLDHQFIDSLGDLCGMASGYKDWDGTPVAINTENKIPLLAAMGFDVSSNASLKQAIATEQLKLWQSPLLPVTVVHQGQSFSFVLRCSKSKRPSSVAVQITLENGDQVTHHADLTTAVVSETMKLERKEYIALEVSIPEYLPLGYHTMAVQGKAFTAEAGLIVVPEVCYEPEAMKQGAKIWGSGIQLYTVRSERNWGVGDLTDLGALAAGMGEQGADFVGLNPVHALYPSNPLHCSPYSPSTRLFDNVLYIDPEQVAEYADSASARETVAKHQGLIDELRSTDLVEYDKVAPLKMSVLELLFNEFAEQHLGKGTDRDQAFTAFCQSRGARLDQFALFEALYEHFRKTDINSWGWRCWPEAYQTPDSKEVRAFAKTNQARITFFKYLQWQMDEQLHAAQEKAKDAGMMVGLYRDLAVGVDSNGADVWTDRNLFVLEASTGAPPDGLGPMGQDWGLPPFNPVVLKEERYQPFVELIRNNMRNCGALRIDHAMGLFRLWWCPNGNTDNKGARYGCYVHYPLQDLLGIIKLESHRQQCLVFGEDLGVVPQEITDSLPPARMYGSVMGIFQQDKDRYTAPDKYREKALAMLVCHDTPTMKGWWDGKDIDLMESLGFFSEERAAADHDAREQTRKAVLNTLADLGELPEGIDLQASTAPAFSRTIMEKFSYYLALSASQITGFQLEDVMMIDSPVNVPGTCSEYPNWRRRLPQSISAMLASKENQQFFANLSGCRKAK